MKKIKVGSFFAGVGGVCLGFKQAGAELSFANEMDPFACNTYSHNFEHSLISGDIEKVLRPSLIHDDVDLTYDELLNSKGPKHELVLTEYLEYKEKHEEMMSYEVDVLTAGFPCQPFSIAGNQLGFADERGNLFHSVIEYASIAKKKPKVLFLENVKNLVGHNDGHTFTTIKLLLERAGYTVKHAVLNTTTYTNLPQNRERIYMVCFLDSDQAKKFDLFSNLDKFKIVKTKDDLRNEIDAVLDRNITEHRYLYTKEKYPNYFMTMEKYIRIPDAERKEHRINLKESVNLEYEFYQVRRGMYVRKNTKGVCPTLTANMGTGGHNVPIILDGEVIRKLTEEECFKLQGFPIGNGFKLPERFRNKAASKSKFYQQAGNAVSVDIIQFIAHYILKTF